MKLSKGLNFNQAEMKIYGFTDLGQYIPEDQKNQAGSTVLIFFKNSDSKIGVELR
jgi:hypothetical protein